jgi:hypothetical protein
MLWKLLEPCTNLQTLHIRCVHLDDVQTLSPPLPNLEFLQLIPGRPNTSLNSSEPLHDRRGRCFRPPTFPLLNASDLDLIKHTAAKIHTLSILEHVDLAHINLQDEIPWEWPALETVSNTHAMTR